MPLFYERSRQYVGDFCCGTKAIAVSDLAITWCGTEAIAVGDLAIAFLDKAKSPPIINFVITKGDR